MAIERFHSQESEETPVDKIFIQYEKTRANEGVLSALGELRMSLRTLEEIPYLGRVDILEQKVFTELTVVNEDDPSNINLKTELSSLLTSCGVIKATHLKEQADKETIKKNTRQAIKEDAKRFGIKKPRR